MAPRTDAALLAALAAPFADGVVHLGKPETDVLLHYRIRLTVDEVKALPTSAAEIIPAPPAGFVTYPLFVILNSHSVAPYENWSEGLYLNVASGAPGATGPWCWYVPWSPGDLVGSLADLLETTHALEIIHMRPGGQSFIDPAAWGLVPVRFAADDEPIFSAAAWYAFIENYGAGNFTGADPANSLTIDTLYVLLPAPVA